MSQVLSFSRSRRNPLATAAGFTRLYQSQALSLLTYFARRVFDAQLAIELTSQAFAVALERRGHFRGQTEADAAAWLWSQARRELNYTLRTGQARLKDRSRSPELGEAEAERVMQLSGSGGVVRAMRFALTDLTSEEREILVMRVIDGLTFSEIGGRLGISPIRARARLAIAMRTLRARTESPGEILA